MSSVRTLWNRTRQSVFKASSGRSRASSRTSVSAGTSPAPSSSFADSAADSSFELPRHPSPELVSGKHPPRPSDALEMAQVAEVQNFRNVAPAPPEPPSRVMAKLIKLGLRRAEELPAPPPASGPAYVNHFALMTLRYTSAYRSRQIIDALIRTGAASADGLLVRQPLNLDSLVGAVSADVELRHGEALSPGERRGLTTYVQGVQQNIDARAQSLAALPEHERPMFLFYSSAVSTAERSATFMRKLQSHGVLTEQLLPRNGEEAFHSFKKDLFARPVTSEEFAELLDWSEKVRDTLFALPSYSAADDRPPSYTPPAKK